MENDPVRTFPPKCGIFHTFFLTGSLNNFENHCQKCELHCHCCVTQRIQAAGTPATWLRCSAMTLPWETGSRPGTSRHRESIMVCLLLIIDYRSDVIHKITHSYSLSQSSNLALLQSYTLPILHYILLYFSSLWLPLSSPEFPWTTMRSTAQMGAGCFKGWVLKRCTDNFIVKFVRVMRRLLNVWSGDQLQSEKSLYKLNLCTIFRGPC